jgi:hypothetical protein
VPLNPRRTTHAPSAKQLGEVYRTAVHDQVHLNARRDPGPGCDGPVPTTAPPANRSAPKVIQPHHHPAAVTAGRGANGGVGLGEPAAYGGRVCCRSRRLGFCGLNRYARRYPPGVVHASPPQSGVRSARLPLASTGIPPGRAGPRAVPRPPACPCSWDQLPAVAYGSPGARNSPRTVDQGAAGSRHRSESHRTDRSGLIEEVGRGPQGGNRERGDLPAARRAQRADQEPLSTVQDLVMQRRKRRDAEDARRPAALRPEQIRERLDHVRQELQHIDSWQGELTRDAVLGLVDTAARQPLNVMAGMFNTNLVVNDKARGRRVLLRFRSQDGRIPRHTEGADERSCVRPADAMVEARRLGVEVPRLLFVAEPKAEHPIEVHEYVPGKTLLAQYPADMSLPRELRARIAQAFVRLASGEPSRELLARYPDAPGPAGKPSIWRSAGCSAERRPNGSGSAACLTQSAWPQLSAPNTSIPRRSCPAGWSTTTRTRRT